MNALGFFFVTEICFWLSQCLFCSYPIPPPMKKKHLTEFITFIPYMFTSKRNKWLQITPGKSTDGKKKQLQFIWFHCICIINKSNLNHIKCYYYSLDESLRAQLSMNVIVEKRLTLSALKTKCNWPWMSQCSAYTYSNVTSGEVNLIYEMITRLK